MVDHTKNFINIMLAEPWPELLCISCMRYVPNKDFFTRNGCIWCDYKYHKQKQKLGKALAEVSKRRKKK